MLVMPPKGVRKRLTSLFPGRLLGSYELMAVACTVRTGTLALISDRSARFFFPLEAVGKASDKGTERIATRPSFPTAPLGCHGVSFLGQEGYIKVRVYK